MVMSQHPSELFEAPHSIPHGGNLAALFDAKAIALLQQSLHLAAPDEVKELNSAKLAQKPKIFP